MTRTAKINWKPHQAGGRLKPPLGDAPNPYRTVIRFLDQPWPTNAAWSVSIEKIAESDDGYEWHAFISFLVDEAPHHELVCNRKFELYEGNKCVAIGTVLELVEK